MALAQSSCNERSVERIKFMVVDHDHVFLETLKHMLESSIFRVSDSWGLECTVLEMGDSREALATLKTQRNNIDFIIADYDMPGLNGVQLKREINQELGNIPVMIMSSDIKNREESLACGAIGFIQKPIDPSDVPTIFHFALTSKKKGKSISTENNPKDKDVSVIPRQINLPPGPEQTDVLKIMEKNSSSMSDSRPNGGCVSPNGSGKDLKRELNGGPSDDDESLPRTVKKPKIIWDDPLHSLFVQALNHFGYDNAKPKNILAFMNKPYLTTKHIASHLQKYRKKMGLLLSNADDYIEEPYYNRYTIPTYGSETSPNNSSLYSPLGHGLGESKPNICEPVRFNQMPPNNNMNWPFTNEPIGSETNLKFSEPAVNANKIGQTSQNLGFGLPGQSGFSGNNFTNNMMSDYGAFTPNQPGTSKFLYGMQPFLSNDNAAYNPHPHVNATDIVPQFVNLNLYGDLSNTNNMSNFETSNTFVVPEMNPPSFNMSPNQNQVHPPSFNMSPNQNQVHPPSFNMSPNQNQVHSSGETSNTFVVPEMNPPSFNMNPNQNQVYSNGETSSTVIVPETNSPSFNMSPNQNEGHSNGETLKNFISRERTPPSFNMIPNQNQGHSDEETSNTFVVQEPNPPFFNMIPNQNQEQDNDPDFMCFSSLDAQELLGVDLASTLFNNDMKWEEFS